MRLLAIDAGNLESGWVFVDIDETGEIIEIKDFGKTTNEELQTVIELTPFDHVALEMIASYGMPVGASVFETCVWIGRFIQQIRHVPYDYIFRREEKMLICGSMKAKDSNIIQALVDIYAPDTPNKGKGSKKEQGFFYGFKKDIWQAFAVAHTWAQKQKAKEEIHETDDI